MLFRTSTINVIKRDKMILSLLLLKDFAPENYLLSSPASISWKGWTLIREEILFLIVGKADI